MLLPAAWHWRARNISTLAIITWLALGNLSLFVNTLIWADNYEDRVPVWCDICESTLLLVKAEQTSKPTLQRYLIRHAGLLALTNAQA